MPTSPDDEPELGDLWRSNDHVVGPEERAGERAGVDEVDDEA